MRPLRFRLLALFAAYAVALHALLLAFAMPSAAPAQAHFASICSGIPADDGGAPPSHHDSSCAFLCAALGAKLGSGTLATIAVAPLVVAVLVPALEPPRRVGIAAGTPRARAPPAA